MTYKTQTYKTQLKKRVLAGLLAGTALWLGMPAALAASGAVPNTQLPDGGQFIGGNTVGSIDTSGAQMTITQNVQNAVIQWDNGFNVGANATVNFKGPKSGYNTLNYDASGNMSQIYGAINANNNGNIYIVNPAGVEISSSAQINVGSLYVSNRDLSEKIYEGMNEPTDMAAFIQGGKTTDAALMSLGNINADHITFDGGRIIIDTERLKTDDDKMAAENIHVRTTDAGQVVLGYDAYNEGKNKGTYDGKQKLAKDLATVTAVDESSTDNLNGYMWVEDIEQLQAVNTNLSGQYALRNSIDATATQDWNDQDTSTDVKEGFASIGNTDKAFIGKFDGLDYNIFNLNIDRDTDNVGLFGVVGNNAVIQNVTLVGGSIKGQNNVGALAGQVSGGAQISNIMNSASVTGSSSSVGNSSNVGGIIGAADQETTDQEKLVFKNLVNTGTVQGDTSVGGLIGSLTGGNLSGTSYNLGGVTGKGSNVGGLVGTASNAALGDGTNLIYNRLNVSGLYNVGGIVGSMEKTTVQNAENSGNVTATGHTMEDYKYHSAHWKGAQNNADQVITQEDIYIANAGGIAGTASGESNISNVQNSGDVSSSTAKKTTDKDVEYTYYTAGNVGGIVGRAENTNISNATNTENDVRGAHNVGGIAGYFGGKGIIKTGINNGGDILATGAVDENTAKEGNITNDFHNNGFVTEWVRNGSEGGEKAIIGNMGGIVGYMDGDNVYITSSANRGTVHSQDIGTEVLPVNQAANAGGIVGKIDRSHTIGKDDATGIIDTENIKNALGENYANAAVSNSYNTGDVRGYMGVGGVAGMMYNGEIAGSYNLGTVNTTRNKVSFTIGDYYAVNMGGVVGDTTEQTEAGALLYDVYNKGQIGDETFTYYARHVGGVVGRLSGAVKKAYNTGAIYNGYSIVGGIVGWLNAGSVTNSFNTGNITVLNYDLKEESNVGGIAGDVNIATGDIVLTNVYNLGTLRSFKAESTTWPSVLGGIVGAIHSYHDSKTGKLLISNAYTTGNLYSDGRIKSIVTDGSSYELTNTYYIRPADTGSFEDLVNTNKDNSNKAIAFADKDQADSYAYEDSEGSQHSLTFTTQGKGSGKVDEGNETTIKADDTNWRIYDGSTPILNAFLPNTENYFSDTSEGKNPMAGISSIQYGTAYDPLLTIINAADKTEDLTFNWQELGANNAAGIAVYGANLTLNDFMATGGSGYFGGMIYSDGALSIESESGGDVALGSASQLYGSSVSISADGNVTIYGDVTATGNNQDGTTRSEGKYSSKDYLKTNGSISVTGGSVDVYGQLTSAKKENTTFVPGINNMAAAGSWDSGDVKDPEEAMSDIGDRFGYTTGAFTGEKNGDISITANGTASEDGHVNVYYGHQQKGFLDTAGSLTVKGSGDVYMDSDLSVGDDLRITAGNNSEAVLDISNIGQVQATKDKSAVAYLHDFLTHFASNKITLNGGKQKIAVDMWGTDETFNLKKFDLNDQDTLAKHLNSLNITANEQDITNQNIVYIWVSTGEGLKNIQTYYQDQINKGQTTGILSYNFALKNDIDASAVTDYVAIGTNSTSGFTGTFDGRDYRIIGLKVTGDNAGIFDTIGKVTNGENTIVGKVEDLRVYSGTFNGIDNAGAVAGVNYGTISNVTTFGNVVTAQGSAPVTSGDTTPSTQLDGQYVGAAGGIAGVNAGTIDNVSASDAVTADDAKADDGNGKAILSTAGGIAGINQKDILNSSSNSAVNASAGSTYALGGIAGVNAGTLSNVDSLGVTTGIYEVGSHNTAIGTQYSDNVGGIAGQNSGTVSEAYNESIVSGRDNVGGILGVNTAVAAEGEESPVQNVSNAARVTGEADTSDTSSDKTSDYVGGLVGSNSGSITNGRNNGEITGSQYVGGLVGNNASDSTLSNLVNDEAASITGDNYVGGIAGSNAGTITADEKNDNLVNRGSITGQMYVGGVAGVNTGIIANTNNDVALYVKDDTASGENAPKYFGGVAGWNKPVTDENGNPISNTGIITNATNRADVNAEGASYVGGVVGKNDGTLSGMNGNYGNVSGKDYVGGVAGENSQELFKVVAVNQGNVTATDGGAGGIFAVNSGEISSSQLTSSGTVTGIAGDENSGTGGIFGVNAGDITGSVLENKGYEDETGFHDSLVTGKSNTGGLIGINSGDVSTSSLKNEANITVEGDNVSNIGGLIGVNTGDITGGRDADDGYYKDQIYNNGTITVTGTGKNIGGLFGTNEVKVTAAYNTGAIDAVYSENVGGIAGTNTGTLDQVFNTVITGVGTDGSNVYDSITGKTNVGGIVGSNTGTVSNAYNTTGVDGNTNWGMIAGSNTNKGKDSIRNVYTTGAGSLVGSGTVTNGYNVIGTDNKWTSSKSYGGFDFDSTSEDGTESIWKIYEGSTNPLLKVFLTKLTVEEEATIGENKVSLKDYLNLVYNGGEQDINIQDLINKGFITGPEGMKDTAEKSFAFDAYDHTKVNGANPFGNSYLLYNTKGQVDVGMYGDWLASAQIYAGSGFVNNLGYDIDFGTRIDPRPSGMPDIPDSERWNSLLRDAPWDRNRNFRERKAEVHFLAGGMTL